MTSRPPKAGVRPAVRRGSSVARRRPRLPLACLGAALIACSGGEVTDAPPGSTTAATASASASITAASSTVAAAPNTPTVADLASTVPGLVDGGGRPVEVNTPIATGGREHLVTDFGADPAPDSADDAPALRAALAAARPGDVVVLGEGTFDLRSVDPTEPSTHVLLRSGVHVIGAGSDASVLVSDFDDVDDSAVLLGEAIDDVVLAGFRVTSTYEGPLGTDTRDGDAGGGPMFGIKVGERGGRGSARVLIEDIRVDRFRRHGISLKATREVTVRRCWIADATSVGPGGSGYGIAVEGRADQRQPDAANDSRHNVVVDNLIDGPHIRHAILLQFPTHNNLIADNTVVGSVLDAIDVHGEGEYLNEITRNVVVDGSRAAIALGNSGGDTHDHGASGERNWVHDNVLISNREGIIVILGTPDTLIESNRIVAGPESEVGVRVEDGPGTVVRDNVVLATDDFRPFDVDEGVLLTDNTTG